MRILKAEFSKALIKPGIVHGRKDTTVEPNVYEEVLCEYYCLGLHKRMNSSRHHVH
jgi:hypothetical protein